MYTSCETYSTPLDSPVKVHRICTGPYSDCVIVCAWPLRRLKRLAHFMEHSTWNKELNKPLAASIISKIISSSFDYENYWWLQLQILVNINHPKYQCEDHQIIYTDLGTERSDNINFLLKPKVCKWYWVFKAKPWNNNMMTFNNTERITRRL